ncbi:MAG: cysteine desulfurase [Rhodobacteraceae bacterium]|nr:cysteine desulfurase [Paracoccaceae bacterium]
MRQRAYLDWNATTPLRPEAREAMVAAMDVAGNPSSVHAEGRAAKGLIEKARAQVAAAFGAEGADIVFTSGATEAAALALQVRSALRGEGVAPKLIASSVEHDCLEAQAGDVPRIAVDASGRAVFPGATDWQDYLGGGNIFALQSANSETGVLQDVEAFAAAIREMDPEGSYVLSDMTQSFGKVPVAFNWSGADMALISAHKLGGPKGVGALVIRQGTDIAAAIKGGGQEMGRRSGTENVIGIAGFGAAAEAATRDLDGETWPGVAKLRNILESTIAAEAKETIFLGEGANRIPNTSCFATPGWKGETQVMQMDLAGFAISAGSACSSGKVRESRVLRAMEFDAGVAASAVRVSLGPETTEDEVMRFCEAWLGQYRKFRARAA